ncbi:MULTISPECIES: Txe/YoeB family addiction module toxin [unclassified Adlercreutzia]|uniref:Txe/YoeB family addiction module toxin n=1 Tax=unclassified Adlercreutzia TaxID=2636013 RepID=UPI0013EA6F4D|nr:MULTISPECIES: Txe/YoeB family addiction module toxin [unclassified Adlercreutzia]
MYHVKFTKQAAKDAKRLKAVGLDKKAKQLIEIVRRDPFQNPPSYEALVGNLSGLYSRRINLQHRFVYQVIPETIEEDGQRFDGTIKVVRMWSHYEGL